MKNAQEAHEAIRPAGDVFRTPGEVSGELNADEFALYDLIWKRTVASQMANAQVATTTVKLGATAADGTDAEFTASGTVIVFPGFYAALKDIVEDAGRRRPRARAAEPRRGRRALRGEPGARWGTPPRPPARYTEAKLVARLEELGIGRPSTYASIMSTIIDRGYVWKKGSALVPSFTAFAVIRLLEEHFTALVDYQFTANMEEVLDLIATGQADRVGQLEAFWRGGHSVSGDFPGVKPLTEDLGAIDARAIATFPIDGTDAYLRVGRYGAYVERGEERANIPVDLAPDELTAEKAEQLLAEPSGDHELGTDPDTGLEIVAKSGRYGPYVTEVLPEGSPKSAKPRTASLFASMSLSTITLEEALRLLSLPRVVGTDPADGVEILAQNGRYGAVPDEGQGLALARRRGGDLHGHARAGARAVRPAQAAAWPRRGQAAAARGRQRPDHGLPLVIKDGRFGPYVTDGTTNASLRTADDPATISVERASDLLSERRSKEALEGIAPKKTTKRVVKKAAAKKTAAKKTAAKKSTAKTTAAAGSR